MEDYIRLHAIRTAPGKWVGISETEQDDYRRCLRRAMFMWLEERLYDSRTLLDVIAAIQWAEETTTEDKDIQMTMVSLIPSTYKKYIMPQEEWLKANQAEQDWAESKHHEKYGEVA